MLNILANFLEFFFICIFNMGFYDTIFVCAFNAEKVSER